MPKRIHRPKAPISSSGRSWWSVTYNLLPRGPPQIQDTEFHNPMHGRLMQALSLSLSLPPPRQKWIRKCHIPIWATSKTNTNLRKLWDSQKLGQNGPSKFDTNLWSGELYLHIAPDLIPRLRSILSITRFLILSRGGPNGAEPGMLDDIIQAQSMFRLMFQQAQKQLLSLRRLRPSAPKTLQIIVAKEVWVIFFAWKRLMVLFIHDSWYKFCFIYAHMCVYIYVYIHVCVCAYIHMYYVHMYIYIYVYVYMCIIYVDSILVLSINTYI